MRARRRRPVAVNTTEPTSSAHALEKACFVPSVVRSMSHKNGFEASTKRGPLRWQPCKTPARAKKSGRWTPPSWKTQRFRWHRH
eukprot:5043491-Pyramimonas_sp.AAC.1